MLSFAALSINRFFTTAPKLERETPGNRTATLRALSDLGESGRIERARHLCAEQAVSLRGDAAQARSASRPKAGG